METEAQQALEAIECEVVAPTSGLQTVKQMSLPSRKELLLNRVYDGVDKIPVEDEIYSMGIERASKVIARLEPKEVKMDCNITAMGILAMFPGVVEK